MGDDEREKQARTEMRIHLFFLFFIGSMIVGVTRLFPYWAIPIGGIIFVLIQLIVWHVERSKNKE